MLSRTVISNDNDNKYLRCDRVGPDLCWGFGVV